MSYTYKSPSPIGAIVASSDGTNITGLWFKGQKYFASTLTSNAQKCDLPIFQKLQKWLNLYFTGIEPNFALPLKPFGSEFRQLIWKELCKIPYGQVVTYGNIAKKLSTSARAIGGAVGHNPISIIIPCHRVIGTNGNLTGYAGGIDKKIQLLKLEGAGLIINDKLET